MSSARFAAVRLGTAALLLPLALILHAALQTQFQPVSPDKRLLHAVNLRDSVAMRHALEDGANVNTCDDMGSTPLHYSAMVGDTATTARLLRQGARVNVQTKLGTTPLMLAAANNKIDAALMLLDAGADVDIRSYEAQTTAAELAEQNEAWECYDLLWERMK